MNQSQSKSDQKPTPGDLIEIFRGLYHHWAVYVVDGWVVHLTSPPGVLGIVSDSLSIQGAVSNSLMSVSTEKAMVSKEKLQEVVGNNKWKINNSLDKKYEPRSAHIIVEEALRQVGEMIDYCFINKNCEHFVNKLRYGKAVSFQVKENAGKYAALSVAVGAAVGAVVGPVGTIVVAAAAVFGLFGSRKTD